MTLPASGGMDGVMFWSRTLSSRSLFPSWPNRPAPQVNSCLRVFNRLPWSVLSLLLGASTGNLSEGFIDTLSVGSQPSTHTPISEHSLSHPFCYRWTYLQNELRQLITCGQNLTTPKGVIGWQRVNFKFSKSWVPVLYIGSCMHVWFGHLWFSSSIILLCIR